MPTFSLKNANLFSWKASIVTIAMEKRTRMRMMKNTMTFFLTVSGQELKAMLLQKPWKTFHRRIKKVKYSFAKIMRKNLVSNITDTRATINKLLLFYLLI